MHWLWALWIAYGWSSVKGNGPEDVLSMLIVGILTALLIPRVRRFFGRHFASLRDHITKGHKALHDRMDTIDASHAELHRHLAHIAKESNLPPLPPKELNGS